MLNPVPVTEPELTVSAAVPVELIVTGFVAVVFNATLPKARLVELTVHAAEVAFSCSEVALLTPPAVAVMVAVVVVLTAEAVAVNGALVDPATTVTEAGTLSEELLLASVTANPPLGAAAESVTEQASVTAPVSELLLQETPLSAACGLSCSEVALLTPAAVAVIVAVVVVLTADAVAVNGALVDPAATVTEAGTVTEELLLASVTANPPLGAAAVSVTVQAFEVAPVSELLLQETPPSAASGFNCSEVVWLTPPAVAVMVAVVVVLTADTVAVNGTLVAPEGTVTDAGTVMEELLLASDTANPPLCAAAVRLTVQASVPAPVSESLLHDTPLSAAAATPVPLKPIIAVPPLLALLTSVKLPASAPAVVGSNDTVSAALWPGFSVAGKDRPEMLNPPPVTEPELMVRGAVPFD